MRFPLSVTEAVRAVVPKEVVLGARITGSDWKEGGITPDEAAALAKALKAAGLDFVCVSSGGVAAGIHNPTGLGYNVPLAEAVKKGSGIKVRAVGLITTAQLAEEIVASGKADMVAAARAFLDDPHFGWHCAKALGGEVAVPPQYLRAGAKMWSATPKA
jgi:NADPH2 dehydrogenase